MSIKRRDVLFSGALLIACGALGLILGVMPALAHEYEIGKLKVEHPWLRYAKRGRNHRAAVHVHPQQWRYAG